MIFFRATSAPVRERARYTSLRARKGQHNPTCCSDMAGDLGPKCSLTQLSLEFVVGYARASVEYAPGTLVVEARSARRSALRRPLWGSFHDSAVGSEYGSSTMRAEEEEMWAERGGTTSRRGFEWHCLADTGGFVGFKSSIWVGVWEWWVDGGRGLTGTRREAKFWLGTRWNV